jgi:hypothetical protein
MLDEGDRVIRQLMVLKRAKQTKSTLNITGEWPMGWVDWGYKDAGMTKTLLEIHDELPDGVSAAGFGIVEADDDFFLTGGNLEMLATKVQPKNTLLELSLTNYPNPIQPSGPKILLPYPSTPLPFAKGLSVPPSAFGMSAVPRTHRNAGSPKKC